MNMALHRSSCQSNEPIETTGSRIARQQMKQNRLARFSFPFLLFSFQRITLWGICKVQRDVATLAMYTASRLQRRISLGFMSGDDMKKDDVKELEICAFTPCS